MYQHILVATDGSRLSDKAAKTATLLAKGVGARLTCFNVMEEYPLPAYSEFGPVVAPPLGAWKQSQKKHALHVLAKVEKLARANGVPCATAFATSHWPYKAIIETAKKRKCDLIVMASHGRRGLGALLLGSETSKVLTHSKIPVLVCR
ncbi:MAG: universal stress protein [Burkholderiales bacterium]